MIITQAKKEHAPLIAKGILLALGMDIVEELASNHHTLDDVEQLFCRLAAMEGTQYSYLNSLVAQDETKDNKVMGIIVGYDGAELEERRKYFIKYALEYLGMDFSEMAPETNADEFYLDSLAVFEEYRNKGVASQLIVSMLERAACYNKPAGLLVDVNNPRAEMLYNRLGFVTVGETEFIGEKMRHKQFLYTDEEPIL